MATWASTLMEGSGSNATPRPYQYTGGRRCGRLNVAQTREIVGVHIGDCPAESAQALWQSLPPLYRQCAVIYSDFWSAYAQVLPSKRHRAVGKETGKTSYIERFNCTPGRTHLVNKKA